MNDYPIESLFSIQKSDSDEALNQCQTMFGKKKNFLREKKSLKNPSGCDFVTLLDFQSYSSRSRKKVLFYYHPVR